ncbi:hypothetical protein AJ80_00420 [Polytolypa hystricis UAMH7299]|uniref:Protein BIG1 n=1 Tax=Polytolypa hystricis (strain UAMH7299) TaxID=1447883 RepID=A0A2B7Z386_POLH7|nr:hypothetical protein AJ80_00420 [Polytolypa hystricis UAMH7299]
MHSFSGLGLLVVLSSIATTSVSAFKDTSPFFLFSTSNFLPFNHHLTSSSSVQSYLSSTLPACPSDIYILVSQPGVHASDYITRKSAPRLRERVLRKDSAVVSVAAVGEVASGVVDADEVRALLEEKCGAETVVVDVEASSIPKSFEKQPTVVRVDFASLPADKSRAQQLVDNDAFLGTIIDLLPSSKDYTVIYTTSPRDSFPETSDEYLPYDMDSDAYQNPVRVDMKRDVSDATVRADDDDDGKDEGGEKQRNNLPLFEKYQFLSPGIFMGLIAGLLFILILYFGISALGSLKVSYAAFEKDTAPNAAKKQQ